MRRIELLVAVLIMCSPAITRAADRLDVDLDARNSALVAEGFNVTIHARVPAAGWRREILIAPGAQHLLALWCEAAHGELVVHVTGPGEELTRVNVGVPAGVATRT